MSEPRPTEPLDRTEAALRRVRDQTRALEVDLDKLAAVWVGGLQGLVREARAARRAMEEGR